MTRTVLEVVQDAAPKMAIDVPSLLFGSTARTDIEVRSLVNELAERIARAHDWSYLKTTKTFTGDGSTTNFALPSDYLRMPKDAQMWSTRWQRPLSWVTPETQLQLSIRSYDLVTGTWAIQGGEVIFSPALASTESAKCLYISSAVFQPASGSNIARATADTDTFLLGDRLLGLMLVWEWRMRKGLSYAEDMRTAEDALAQAISDDKGARMLTQASRHNIRANVAYPWELPTS